ncbi:MAG TPA: transketolase [Candidatus Woesearchaeota archaeon]|nr:transketolase [Candidatus Woesearchaeota archaeon]
MTSIQELEAMANKLRIHSLKSTTAAGSGHPTSCLSCAEIMSALFFSELREEDEFILSKGHAAPILWAVYAEAGIIPVEELMNLRKIDSVLEGHPTTRMPFVKVATGSLGQGLAAGVGMALAKKLEDNPGRVYVLLGDGEVAEGSVWEAASSAACYKLSNLCAIIDINRLGQSQETMHGHDLDAYEKKFKAFGWDTSKINGHSIEELLHAFEKARNCDAPQVILARTIKGKGVSEVEDQDGWHGKALKPEMLEKALQEIRGVPGVKLGSSIKFKKSNAEHEFNDFRLSKEYALGEMIATREAFGRSLVEAGKANSKVVVLDGDVKNSTMTEYFFAEFPERSFECFIAEQNMVGVAIGFSAMGFTPFVATFGAFLTRAYDFIRMAQYSNADIKFVGSHAGISIGADGPSQMGLEDLSMFLAMPNSVVLYPSDAVSAEKLVKEMIKHRGISYLRTTRERTRVIYNNNEDFPIGGLKVLRQSEDDKAMVIGAGITVHEALRAHEELQKDNISIRVVDLYSVKPVDKKALLRNAEECNNNVVVVEDHYANGIGSVVSEIVGRIKHLCIKEIPRSGKPEELRSKYGIDANAIMREVKKLL